MSERIEVEGKYLTKEEFTNLMLKKMSDIDFMKSLKQDIKDLKNESRRLYGTDINNQIIFNKTVEKNKFYDEILILINRIKDKIGMSKIKVLIFDATMTDNSVSVTIRPAVAEVVEKTIHNGEYLTKDIKDISKQITELKSNEIKKEMLDRINKHNLQYLSLMLGNATEEEIQYVYNIYQNTNENRWKEFVSNPVRLNPLKREYIDDENKEEGWARRDNIISRQILIYGFGKKEFRGDRFGREEEFFMYHLYKRHKIYYNLLENYENDIKVLPRELDNFISEYNANTRLYLYQMIHNIDNNPHIAIGDIKNIQLKFNSNNENIQFSLLKTIQEFIQFCNSYIDQKNTKEEIIDNLWEMLHFDYKVGFDPNPNF